MNVADVLEALDDRCAQWTDNRDARLTDNRDAPLEATMPAPQTDRRPDALEWAKENGWKHELTTGFDSEVIRDVFTREGLELRCFWLSTPFSEALWARGYLLMPYRAVTVPRVTSSGTRPSVEAVLKLQHKLTQA